MFTKGHEKIGGRVKGTPNRISLTATQILASLKCDPITGMARIALGDVPCNVCKGTGKTKYQPAKGNDKLAVRTCESCYGSKKEKIAPELSGRMYAELAKYTHPQLKQVEHRGEGMQNRPSVQITFVEAQKALQASDGPVIEVQAENTPKRVLLPKFTNGNGH